MTKDDTPRSDWREIGRRHELTYWVALIILLTLVILYDQEPFSPHRIVHNIAAAGAVAAIATAIIGRFEVKLYKKARLEARREEYERWEEWRTNGQNTPPPSPPQPDPPPKPRPTQDGGGSGTGPGTGAGS